MKPILFNTEMAKAILEGRKTQTRRAIGLDMTTYTNSEARVNHEGMLQFRCPPENNIWDTIYWGNHRLPKSRHGKPIKCPYGQVGDKLYLQEPIFIGFGGMGKELGTQFRYINNPEPKMQTVNVSYDYNRSYRPASKMPKYAARTFLEITNIRVERVQDITEDDAINEGVTGGGTHPDFWVGAFRELWDSINSKRGYGWDKNPWVWAVDFSQIGDKLL